VRKIRPSVLVATLLVVIIVGACKYESVMSLVPLDLTPRRNLTALVPGSLDYLKDDPNTLATFNFDFEYTIDKETMPQWLDELDSLYQQLRPSIPASYWYPSTPVIGLGYHRDGYLSISVIEGADYAALIGFLEEVIVPQPIVEGKRVPLLVEKGQLYEPPAKKTNKR